MPQVAPYSGDILPIVARSASGRSCSPGPKYSTNFPTTPCLRSISVIVRTRSVAVAPSRNLPVNFTPTTSGISMDTGCPNIAASASIPPTPQPIHHGCVTVGAYQSVGVGGEFSVFFFNENYSGQVFEIDLMDDSSVGRDDG